MPSRPIATESAAVSGPRMWWLGLTPGRRRLLRRMLAAGVILLLLVGFLLARFLSVENSERDADLALVEAQARGDLGAMIADLPGCSESSACLATLRANASSPRLRKHGAIKILSLESPTAYSLTGATGTTRLAWTIIGSLPVVQCIGVRRSGNFLSGIKVTLLSLSAPIPNEDDC